ncbi:MAG: PilW family protein [Candidatus Rokuibacteriota bacterium]
MSLAELLASLAVLGLVLAAAVVFLASGQRAYLTGTARVESQQSARVALARMAREIRQAGFGPTSTDFSALSVFEPKRLVLHMDLDADGLIAGRPETITWLLGADGVLRRDAGGGAQPVINGVRSLSFTYLGADGAPTPASGEVRSVVIRLTTGPEGSPTRREGLITLVTEVRLRNR